MAVVHLIRHGETQSNVENRFQGQRDIPLSAKGVAQAESLANQLAAWRIDRVYCSDLSRATQTADIVAAGHVDPAGQPCRVVPDPRWRELDVGEWTGRTTAEVAQLWPTEFRGWQQGHAETALPGGESFRDLMDRVAAALADIVAANPDGTVAVVAHGVSLRAAIAAALGAGPELITRLRLANCSVSTLEQRAGAAAVLRRANVELIEGDGVESVI